IALRFTSTGNSVPTAADDAYTTNEDTPLSVPAPGVLGNDTDPESDPLSAILVAPPAHGSVTLNANGSFTYTPTANYHGPDSFTYKASDGWAESNVATVGLIVGSVNDPPIASSDAYQTNQNQALNVAAPGVLANDTDADGDTLTAILDAVPAHGSVTLNANGSFTYTPTTGYSGTDSFTYEAYDGTTLSNETTVTITVSAPAPTAVISIAMSKSVSKSYWKAKAAVTVKDSAGKAIGSATVTGHWSGVTTGSATGTTSSKGTVSFTSASIRTSGTATFTVDSVTKGGQTYTLAGQTSASISGP
ncbi:MAG: tandem-95 repeat protein, partial [Planctomycetes bacterium]|nr:tandem-95 repeat protein [Planctomycetota bacterium]